MEDREHSGFPEETREKLISLAEKSTIHSHSPFSSRMSSNKKELLGPSKRLSEMKKHQNNSACTSKPCTSGKPQFNLTDHSISDRLSEAFKHLGPRRSSKNLAWPPPPGAETTVAQIRYSNIYPEGFGAFDSSGFNPPALKASMNRSADCLSSESASTSVPLRSKIQITPPENPKPVRTTTGDIRLEDLKKLYSSLPDCAYGDVSDCEDPITDSKFSSRFYVDGAGESSEEHLNQVKGQSTPSGKGLLTAKACSNANGVSTTSNLANSLASNHVIMTSSQTPHLTSSSACCSSPTDSGYRSVPRLANGNDPRDYSSNLTGAKHGQGVKSTIPATPNGHNHPEICVQGAIRVVPSGCGESTPLSIPMKPQTHAPISPAPGDAPNSTKKHGLVINCSNRNSVDDPGIIGQNGEMEHILEPSRIPPVTSSASYIPHSFSMDETLQSVSSAYSDDLSSPGSYPNSSSRSSLADQAIAEEPSRKIRHAKNKLYGPKYPASIPKTSANGLQHAGSLDTVNTNTSLPLEEELLTLDRCPKLPELDQLRLPWNEKDVVRVLQRGRTKEVVDRIAIDVVPRLTYLLQRPLIRIAREAQRLCAKLGKLTKHDIQIATRIILPGQVAAACSKAGMQAGAMFAMSGDNLRQSKSHRAGLRFSVGKMHRWLSEAGVSPCIHEQAAVLLTACLECLLEEVVLQSLQDSEMLTAEDLSLALGNNPDLWGLLQPYQHLICSRTANGMLSLPNHLVMAPQNRPGSRQRKHERMKTNGSIVRNVEQCLLATCAGNVNELADLINRISLQQAQQIQANDLSMSTASSNTSSSSGSSHGCVAACGLPVAAGRVPMPWSRDALQTLYYYMRCQELEPPEGQTHGTPRDNLLGGGRPFCVLPPLIEWMRVSIAHCEHRLGHCIDPWDVLQAARVLLPGVDCPPRFLSQSADEASMVPTGRLGPLPHPGAKQSLGFKMLTSGRPDLIPHPNGLPPGSKHLDAVNEMGLTPLMLACSQGDELAMRILLDSGADLHTTVPSQPTPACPSLNPELAGWAALTFAVANQNTAIVQYLLEQGALTKNGQTPTDTPLQLAAMMGNSELVNLLLAHGADPFQSTYSDELRQRGCASALALAAAHGHRTLLQMMLSRRKARNDEMLSLEDFLAEGAPQNGRSDKPQHLNKSQTKTLQEAMYNAAECAHIDIVMDLRNLGLSWTTYMWSRTLAIAHEHRRKALVQLLLSEFLSCKLDDFTTEFIDDSVPLIFDIFRMAKNDTVMTQVAEILTQLYGDEPIPAVITKPSENTPRIDSRYVNNPELSDVQFLVHGKVFYGHKIVLVSASERFDDLIRNCKDREIRIDDTTYDVFEIMMQYLYKGNNIDKDLPLAMLLQLLCSAHNFGLSDLLSQCERRVAKHLSVDNCITIYSQAMKTHASQLLAYAEGFFLRNLSQLLDNPDPGFRKLLYCSPELISSLQSALSLRMKNRRL